MNQDIDTLVLESALSWLRQAQDTILVTVARTWGASPRQPGSLMAVNGAGETVGSVSGGCIEDDLISRIKSEGVHTVCQGQQPSVLRYGISADEAHRFGLPCGGTIELVLEPLSGRSRVAELLQACRRRAIMRRVLDLDTGNVQLESSDHQGLVVLTNQSLTTWVGPQARLILIGAGDIAHFICEMTMSLGFDVLVCDPREERRATWRLPQIMLTSEMPDDLILRLKPDARTAVVALTHDPKLDDLALIDALQSRAFYVGAIGSRRNSAQRVDRLREHFGLSPACLKSLRGPVGLRIGSKTPAEIALSIVAEIVAVKNAASVDVGARGSRMDVPAKAPPMANVTEALSWRR